MSRPRRKNTTIAPPTKKRRYHLCDDFGLSGVASVDIPELPEWLIGAG